MNPRISSESNEKSTQTVANMDTTETIIKDWWARFKNQQILQLINRTPYGSNESNRDVME